jgi:hypothetical protein
MANIIIMYKMIYGFALLCSENYLTPNRNQRTKYFIYLI